MKLIAEFTRNSILFVRQMKASYDFVASLKGSVAEHNYINRKAQAIAKAIATAARKVERFTHLKATATIINENLELQVLGLVIYPLTDRDYAVSVFSEAGAYMHTYNIHECTDLKHHLESTFDGRYLAYRVSRSFLVELELRT